LQANQKDIADMCYFYYMFNNGEKNKVQFDKTLLKHLNPIKQLQNEHRLQMLDQMQMIELGVGEELSANEEHRSFLYLLTGKIDLLEVNTSPVLLKSSDDRARHPLFNESDHKTCFVAHSHCVIARFDRHQFHAFVNQELLTGEELETIEMNEVEGNLFNAIMHAFNMGDLKLPSLPDIAIKVKKALLSPYTSADDVARIISADPAMATRLVNVANGPLNRSVDSIKSIQAAVVRLGTQTSKELVTIFAIKQLFSSKSKLLNRQMHELYDQSIDIAAISFALSKKSGMLLPEHAMLAGLLHEIGVIPILSYIEETGLVINEEAELNNIVNHLKGAVGSMVIQHWGLSDDLIAVVDENENWQRNNEGDIDACDIVIIAQIYRRLKHRQLNGLPDINEVPAFQKLYPGNQDADFAKNVFQQAHEEVASIMQLLKM
jgi:HD-like signal output (HDOD) protein